MRARYYLPALLRSGRPTGNHREDIALYKDADSGRDHGFDKCFERTAPKLATDKHQPHFRRIAARICGDTLCAQAWPEERDTAASAGNAGGVRVNVLELVQEVHEKTHVEQLEILEIVREAWPGHAQFTPTQARLVVYLIEKRGAQK